MWRRCLSWSLRRKICRIRLLNIWLRFVHNNQIDLKLLTTEFKSSQLHDPQSGKFRYKSNRLVFNGSNYKLMFLVKI